MSDYQRLRRTLLAAGVHIHSVSFGGDRTPMFHVRAPSGQDMHLDFAMVESWLAERGLTPSSEALRIEELREETQALRLRIDAAEGYVTTMRHAMVEVAADRLALCYASSAVLFFTSALDRVWGDDWDDAPYDCNAGTPYDWRPTAFEGEPYLLASLTLSGVHAEYACDRGFTGTAEAINKRRLPWLYLRHITSDIPVCAGASLRHVRDLVASMGGQLTMGGGQ